MIDAAPPARESIVAGALWGVYERLPLAMDAALDAAHHRLSTLAQRRLPLLRVRGTHPTTGRATCVIVADPAPSVDYFVLQLVGADAQRESLGDVPLGRLVDALDRHAGEATLLMGRIDRRLGDRVFPASWTRLPESINTWMSTPEHGLFHDRAKKSQASNLRRIREHNLTWRVSHDSADFDSFYHDMYVPFVLRRHGELAYVRGYHRLRRYMRRGGILWVLRDGQCITGELFYIQGDTLHWVCTGTPGGGDESLSYGAGTAHYMFGVVFARERGLSRFDLGDSRPSLADGVLQHKLRWGAAIRPSPRARRDLVLRWPCASDEIDHFLADSIPIARNRGELIALTAVAPGTGRPREIIQAPGIKRIDTLRV